MHQSLRVNAGTAATAKKSRRPCQDEAPNADPAFRDKC